MLQVDLAMTFTIKEVRRIDEFDCAAIEEYQYQGKNIVIALSKHGVHWVKRRPSEEAPSMQ